jgi:diguanylate cyclase (GGDEF)-like protein/PAS domain S-box-containing protein
MRSNIVESDDRPNKTWLLLTQKIWHGRRVLLTALGVGSFILFLRFTGILQPLELAALDQLFRWRPLEPSDDRIVIVGINEKDLRQVGRWPIPDAVLANLLKTLQTYEPRAIGLDIYRDLTVEPGHQDLVDAYETMPNLIGIEKIRDESGIGVLPPPQLARRNQTGFNNVVIDVDGRVRRSLLYWRVDDEQRQSFALSLALLYLQLEKIEPQPATSNPEFLQLGQGTFRMFSKNAGGYVRADAGGYQVLTNFRGPAGHFRTVSLEDVLTKRVDPNLFRDRIVLIGSTATSLKDFSYTPYSGGLVGNPQLMSGVELQANFISQILSAALQGRSLMRVWADPLEWLWVLVWAWVGARVSWQLRSPYQSVSGLLVIGAGLCSISYVAFLVGWWIPLVPPLFALSGAAIAIVGYLAHQEEELKRSKEFLQTVINTIPDPIFVKNQAHQWIVLNQAFCRFIGHSVEELLEKTDFDFLPIQEAEMFWQEDERVFNGNEDYETEEQFTDVRGTTHLIATRRSLHQDAAGNLFLVGVMRDITERKRREKDLEKTAYYDTLTGLPNRKFFYERLEQSLRWAHDNQQLVALLFLDLDGFKLINDTYGHDIGDLFLKAVAQRLTGCLRGSDIVSRLAGDEFTIILSGIRESQDAIRVAEKILAVLTQEFVVAQAKIRVTTSIGISIYPFNAEEVDALVKNADKAMYRAKELGKNRYECSPTT